MVSVCNLPSPHILTFWYEEVGGLRYLKRISQVLCLSSRCFSLARFFATRPFSSLAWEVLSSSTLQYASKRASVLGKKVMRGMERASREPTTGRSKDWLPLSRNFYVRTCVKFTFAYKREAMYERSHVSIKVEPRSTSRCISTLYILPLFYLRDWNLRALTCVAKNTSVEINLSRTRWRRVLFLVSGWEKYPPRFLAVIKERW